MFPEGTGVNGTLYTLSHVSPYILQFDGGTNIDRDKERNFKL
ncbi:hypothetical protein ACWF5S_04460 [Peribacillus butanolivorans]